ncbi:MAG: tripartite tricarboxylate transporter permease, partial [Rhodospirillales bacterium]
MALFLPLGFKLPTPEMLGLLIGIYKGCVFGGSISTISFATPGTPEAAATVYDGYKLMLARQGAQGVSDGALCIRHRGFAERSRIDRGGAAAG